MALTMKAIQAPLCVIVTRGLVNIRITEIYAKSGTQMLQQAKKSFEMLQERNYDLVTPVVPPRLGN